MGTHGSMTQRAQVFQGLFVLLRILNLYPEVILMSSPSFGEIAGMLVESSLSTNANRGVQVERQLIDVDGCR